MRRRVSVKRLLLALVLGVVTTVAVAWVLALKDIPGREIASTQVIHPERGPVIQAWMGGPANSIRVSVAHARGRLVASSKCYGPDYAVLPGIPLVTGEEFIGTPPDKLAPESIRSMLLPWLFGLQWPRGQDQEWRTVQASGWPLLALATDTRRETNYTYQQRFGYRIEAKATRSLGDQGIFRNTVHRALPFRPLWPGFIVNTLSAAMVYFGAFSAVAAFTRVRRARRNLCSRCAYDLSATPEGLPCPECGRARV